MAIEHRGVAEAFYEAILNDADIVSRLSVWEDNPGSTVPAIFTTEVIPESCGLPAVIIYEEGGPAWDVRGSGGADVLCRIRLYDAKNRNTGALRDLAWRIRELVHRNTSLNVYGYRAFRCLADAPMYITDADGFPGFVINARVLVLQSEAGAPDGS